MATLLAPYNQAMQLGTGFNSFTQQLCIDNAVVSPRQLRGQQQEDNEPSGDTSARDAARVDVSTKDDAGETEQQKKSRPIAQDVSYKASIIDKVTDVASEMNINAAFAIKYDAFDAKGKFDFLNTSKVKESDISFLFSVKVVNQVLYDHTLTEIVPIGIGEDEPSTLDAQAFTDIYGDCFISGFQEGGTFTAVISVKAKSEKKKRDIKAKADVFFTKPKAEQAQKVTGNKGNNSFRLNLAFDNLNDNFLRENETTISVSYTGGGQELKTPEEDWTFDTMKSAALRFPSLVAETPMRTHAILTKYISLRSYHTRFGGMSPPNFEVAAVYCMLLQEAYLDYKTVAKDLQVLAFDVSSCKVSLITSSEYRQKVEEAKKEKARQAAEKRKKVDAINNGLPIEEPVPKSGSDTPASSPKEGDDQPDESTPSKDIKQSEKAAGTDLGETTSKPSSGPNHWQQINITKEYKATLQGLEDARSMVRTFLVRIVQEINILSKSPNLALENNRVQPHMSPFLFKELLPVGQPVATDEEQDQIDNVTDRIGQDYSLLET
ncbi:hypothetical protein FMUND_14316 [Fusarium mundagurra]|uniref:Uncharacterized protein n=1 Tax=Fusarium mundagurra TaxID=1567541 RepID=A0A8H5XUJ4_9HYPO|nr:hypothetical protein FMUND_14316 [Fusarium mundagurra]